MMKRSVLAILAGIGVCVLSAAVAVAGGGLEGLDVPLTIQDVAGVERTAEPCSTGVPLPCGLLMEPKGLAVFAPNGKPVPAQFRVLERWREKALGKGDLSVKWLLVTFLADVPKGGKAVYRLKAGKNPSPLRPVKIEEKGGAFEMGGLTFKKDFTAPFKLVLTDPEGKEITTKGQEIKWSVWEQGPVRACLKAESPTDHGRFGFIAWVYAHAGQKRWDMTVVLKNTPNKMIGPFYFKDFSVVWQPPELEGAKDYMLGGEWGKAASGKLEAGKPAWLYQSSDGSDKWDKLSRVRSKRGDWVNAYVVSWSRIKELGKPEFRGYKTFAGDKETASGNSALGWAGLSGGGKGALVCVRHFLQQYPKAAEVEPGRLTARLWPKYWKAHGGLHWLDDCQRKAHDVSFRLLNGPAKAETGEAAARAFDSPLVIHCGLDWYRETGVRGFIPAQFQGRIVKEKPPKVADKQAPSAGLNWVTFGGSITDRIRRRMHTYSMRGFVRSGDPRSAHRTFTGMRHSAGMTPFWVDEYRYPRDKGMIWPGYCTPPRKDSSGSRTGKYREKTGHHGYCAWNNQHFCCWEIFDSWRLFGDPLALDAARDIGIFTRFYVDWRKGRKTVTESRCDALPMSNLCEAYRLTGDEGFLNSARDFAASMWKTVSRQRGYYAPNTAQLKKYGPLGADKPFMLARLMNGLRAYRDLSGDETAADMVTGITDFIMAEGSIGKWGFSYEIPIDLREQAKYLKRIRESKRKELWYGGLTAPNIAWCYRHTGERRYLEWFDQLHRHRRTWKYANYAPPRKDTTPPEPVTDLAAEALGGGRVKLTWAAPAGEPVRYQVKWAERPMVWRIKFPEQKDTHANWWAANNVDGEPKPAAAGTKQSMVVEGVSPGKRHFNIRGFDAESNRGDFSNMAGVEVK